jgi:hypothetical protein
MMVPLNISEEKLELLSSVFYVKDLPLYLLGSSPWDF